MSIPTETRQWILRNKPTALPTLSGPSPTFTLTTAPLDSPTQDQLLLQTLYLSNDPAQRGWISPTVDPARLYTTPVELNSPMHARGICKVLKCNAKGWEEGELVLANPGWREYAVLDAAKCQKLPNLEGLDVGVTQSLGALGGTGLTAWFGINEVAKAGAEDTVVVSGAAGATGSMVVQIAKHIIGCKRVVGIAGGAEKCKWVKEHLGADACVDYKSASFVEELKRETEGFVEVYFDNVGGEILDLMLTRIKRHGRIAACGAVAEYNKDGAEGYGIKNWFEVVSNRIEIKGFIVWDFLGKAAEATKEMVKATREGKIKIDAGNETVVETGFEGVPETWMKLFEGGNRGKLITKLV
ncbi:MAG: hypothetical protein L6R42_008975 [Xanthoria sp. 1 TBL-2021]|nr:MAG: hypothetical protein L6R42_008975 [Xanthoria sp. 1 TBL-2021]